MITFEQAKDVVKRVRNNLDSFTEHEDAWYFFESQEGFTTAVSGIVVMKNDGSWKLPWDYFMGDAVMDVDEVGDEDGTDEADYSDWDKLVFVEKSLSGDIEYTVDIVNEYESYKVRYGEWKSRYNTLTEERLEIIENAISEVKLFSWEERYYQLALDGYSWSVTIYKDGQEIFKSSGSNAYPKEYNEWKVFIRNFAIHGGGLIGTEDSIILNVKNCKE